jgi:hypothetical protein
MFPPLLDTARALVGAAYLIGLLFAGWARGLFAPLLPPVGLATVLVATPVLGVACVVGVTGGLLAVVALVRSPAQRTVGAWGLAAAGVVGPLAYAWYWIR